VAAARGYQVVPRCPTESQAVSGAKLIGANLRTSQGKRIKQALLDGDVLVMPWFVIGDPTHVAATQVRPDVPGVDKDGRDVKYEFLAEQRTPLGQHPMMPVSWLADPTVPVMLVEGMIKADSALTALLRAWEAPTCQDLPDHARVAIISFAGVGNWGNNPEWAHVCLANRSVWVGFDADVRTNPAVHTMAARLWDFLRQRGAKPSLLDLARVTAEKGVDDYLASGATWDDLLACLSDDLPALIHVSPTSGDNGAGGYRINADGTDLERWVDTRDATGAVTGGGWQTSWSTPWGTTSVPLGGRVLALKTTRAPADAEDATGVFGAGVDADDSMVKDVELAVSWRDPATGDVRTATITGDSSMVDVAPDKWATMSSLRVTVPDQVRLLPCWPPSGPAGSAWLKAVKANSTDVDTRTVWTRDGWVPQERAPIPAFIVGPHTIGDDGGTLSGTRKLLQRWESYGVGEPDVRDITDPDYIADVRDDLTVTLETFSRAFTNPGTFAAAILTALRPVVPVRPKTPVYVAGHSGGGKTFTASAILSFWSSQPGAFHKDALPGSAQDSVPFTENVLASAVIHVADDLAPSSSGKKAEQEQATIESLLRNVFNGTGRGRSNPDGTARQARPPHALLIATAENELFVESIRNRVLPVSMGRGALPRDREPTDNLDALCNVDGAPARVTRAAIALMRHLATTGFADPFADPFPGRVPSLVSRDPVAPGWANLVSYFKARRDGWRSWVSLMLTQRGFTASQTTRASDMLSDIVVSADLLALLLRHTGADPRQWGLGVGSHDGAVWSSAPPQAAVRPDADPATASSFLAWNMARETLIGIVPNQKERSQMTPGRAFLSAVCSLLRSGDAHLVTRGDVLRAPGSDQQDAVDFGWGPDGDGVRAKGRLIGSWGLAPTGEPLVCLSIRPAFTLAKKVFPDLIPAGSSVGQVSTALRSEGLLFPGVVFDSEATSSSYGRATIGGCTTTGTILTVDALFGSDSPTTPTTSTKDATHA